MIYDAKNIRDLVSSHWGETGFTSFTGTLAGSNSTQTLTVTGSPPTIKLQLDEFDPMHPDFEIVFSNRPEKIIYVSPNVVKHEQDVIVQIFNKLIKYNQDDIEQLWRPLIEAMKGELTRVFNTNRFDVQPNVGSPKGSGLTGITINHSNWRDAKFPHGLGPDRDPLMFITAMTCQIHWYEGLDGSAIGVRVSGIDILGSNLLGVIDADFEDMDPWVLIQVPKGPLIEQHLKGPHVDGTIRCHDYNSIQSLLYNTAIPESSTQRPINSDMSKTVFSTTIPSSPEFILYFEDALGNSTRVNFYNVRIKKVRMNKATTSGMNPLEWEIHWMADYMYVGTP